MRLVYYAHRGAEENTIDELEVPWYKFATIEYMRAAVRAFESLEKDGIVRKERLPGIVRWYIGDRVVATQHHPNPWRFEFELHL